MSHLEFNKNVLGIFLTWYASCGGVITPNIIKKSFPANSPQFS